MVMVRTILVYNGSRTRLEDCSTPTWGYDISAVQVLGYCLAFTPIITVSINVIAMVFIIRAPKLKTNTRVFLCSLTVCDALVGIVVLPFRIYGIITAHLADVMRISGTLCDITNSLDVMLCASSIMHLSVLAYDRFLATCRPFKRGYWLNRKSCIVLFIGTWIVPAILSFGVIPLRFHLRGIERTYDCLLEQTKMCHFMANKSYAMTITLLGYAIPAIFILICNNCTLAAVERRRKLFTGLLNINTKRASVNRRHFGTKLARTIYMMTLGFLGCWLPFFVINFTDPLTSYRVPPYVWLLVTWLGYLNYALNPVIYLKFTGLLSFRLQY